MASEHPTFRQFLLRNRQAHGTDKDLIFLLEDIATACRIISHRIRSGAFAGVLGATSDVNVQGETQKQLDVIANDAFIEHCANCGRVAALISEEVDDILWLKETPQAGDYLVYFDPLDGSSNLDVNLSVGSIFSIVELQDAIERTLDEVVLQKGSRQIGAGYAMYGPSTSLVVTTGHGVNGFTHQQGTGEFRLTFPDMRIPAESCEFAINASRYHLWDPCIRRYIDECLEGKNGPRQQSHNMRWTASMVADVHRILTRGGVFLYPIDRDNASAGGKLRLMYEANPLGMVVEQAGGLASTGTTRILDLEPQSHHQRIAVVMGSSEEVLRIKRYYAEAESTVNQIA